MRCALAAFLLFAIPAVADAETKIGFRQLTSTHPVAVQQGTTGEVKLRSNYTLDGCYRVLFDRPGIEMTYAEPEPKEAPRSGRGSVGTPFRFQVAVPNDQPPGVYEYRVATRQSVSSSAQLLVTPYPVVEEQSGQNGTVEAAQPVGVPAAICGTCEAFEDVDCYRIPGSAGQALTFNIFAQRVTDRIHNMVVRGPRIYLMDPILTLYSPNGQIVAQNDNFIGGDAFIHHVLQEDGDYVLEVRDARYAGNARYTYCVEIADRPLVHAVFPMAIERGQMVEATPIGHLLDGTESNDDLRITLASSAEDELGWTRRPLEVPAGKTNPVPILISEHPQRTVVDGRDSVETAMPLELPVGVTGWLKESDQVHIFSFEAKKGSYYRFEVLSHRRGLPLDSVLEVTDSDGKKLAESDDGFQTKDSRLDFQAPSDGKYFLTVRDLHGRGGERFLYHLKAEESGPDFELQGEYYYSQIAPGTRMMWFAKIDRLNGFDGPVRIGIEGLPASVTLEPAAIPPGMNHCGLILSAAEDATIDAALVRVFGTATVTDSDGQSREIKRYGRVTTEQQSSGGGQARWPIETSIVGVTEPLDLVKVTAEPTELTLAPGEKAELTVRIERNEGFTDPVTLAMSFLYFKQSFGDQLPPGVKMGAGSQARLSGNKLEGKIVLEADKDATVVERLPIAVLARVSITFSITTNYASNPVYLTVNNE